MRRLIAWVRDTFAKVGKGEEEDDPERVPGGEDASQYFGEGEEQGDDKQ